MKRLLYMTKLEEQFIDAYDKYSAAILRHIFFRVSDEILAQDITQDTFFKAWRSITGGEKQIENFKSFLYRIANNLIIDHYRRKPRVPFALDDVKDSDLAEDAPQEKEVEHKMKLSIVEKHLENLDDDCKQIILYRYVDDFSVKEISAITGKTPNNISVIIHRGLKTLKNQIHV